MSKFTNGPWVYDENHPFNAYSDDKTGSIVATCDGFKYAPRPDAEKIANARLIAAAPRLFDLVVLVQGSFGGGNIVTFSDEDIKEFAAAIAQVEGENQ